MESHDQTVARLRQLMDEGQFGDQGRMPPERELAADLGVGRRSLRRALGVLEREGRIAREQGRGTFVRGPNLLTGVSLERISEHTSPPEVIELRLALEPIAARLAAVRASQCEIRTIQRLVEATRAAEGPDVYEQADAAFHRAVIEAAHNALYLAVFDAIVGSRGDAGWQRLSENGRCFKKQSVYADNHAEIAQAITLRDGERAAQLMHAHLRDVQGHIFQHAFALTLSAA